MKLLQDKAIVVTGAGGGVGRGHAIHLARAGARVVVGDMNAGGAEETVTKIRAEGGTAVAVPGDIGTRQGNEDLVARCLSEFGRLDAFVANAGITRDKTLLNMVDEEFADVLRVHVWGTFWGCQTAARKMKEAGTGGVLITTTSAAHWGHFGQVNYSGAKGAIASMTYTMATELARYGIRVNCISPSGTTGMSTQRDNPEFSPGGPKWQDPSRNAPMVVYLCSDECDYVTGQVFGTEGETISLLSQPKYVCTLFMSGGWTVEALQQQFKSRIGNRLESFTPTKPPYPYYDGVKRAR